MTSRPDGFDREANNAMVVAIARTGDREAFAHLFATFAPLLNGYLRRSGCANGESEELTQETMLTVWRKAHQFDAQRGSASTWIFTIARNLRIDGLRRRPMDELPPEPDLDPAPSPYDVAAAADSVTRLQVALAKLPPEQAEVLRAAYVEHHAHAAIAEKLGLPLGTVKSRLRLALQRLRAEMEAPL